MRDEKGSERSFILPPSSFSMNPPLLEVILQLHFDPVLLAEDRLQYFFKINSDSSNDIRILTDRIELSSNRGVSFPRLRSDWTRILDSFFDIFRIHSLNHISLGYLNEIPIQDLRDFRNLLNLRIEMPPSLNDRFEFFRTECTYKYDFGEIRVWLQPDWDEQLEEYCIQLNLESRHAGVVRTEDIFPKLQELHEGIKDLFRQILSEAYIRQLPQ